MKYLVQEFSIDHYNLDMLSCPIIVSKDEIKATGFIKISVGKLGNLSLYDKPLSVMVSYTDGQMDKYGEGLLIWKEVE